MTRVERAASNKTAILFRWPDSPLTLPVEILCDSNETVVFVQHGGVIGALGPGKHALDPSSHPFLFRVLDAASQALSCELWFVTTSEVTMNLNGGSTPMIDPSSAMMVEVLLDGEARLRVVDPSRFCTTCLGMGSSKDGVLPWLRDRILMRLGDALGKSVQSRGALVEVLAAAQNLTAQVASELRPDLSSLGIEIAFRSLKAHLSEADAARLSVRASDLHKPPPLERPAPPVERPAPPLEPPAPPAPPQQIPQAIPPAQPVVPLVPEQPPAAAVPLQPTPQQSAPRPEAQPVSAPLPAGTSVLVQWTDGRWYPASISSYHNGHYCVMWASSNTGAWVPAQVVRPS